MIVAGIDVGFKAVKVVILAKGDIVSHSIAIAGIDPKEACELALRNALESAGLSAKDLAHITATGAGRKAVPFADDEVQETVASAKGAVRLFPSARTVIDVGAEGSMAVSCDAAGNVVDIARNDKCAAGAGSFFEAVARALEVTVEAMGALSLQAQNEVQLDATCAIFAESEVVSLIHAGTSKADITRSVHNAIATRTALMARRIGLREDVVIIGGLAKDVGFVAAMQRHLGVSLKLPADPQIATALGAALVANQSQQSAPKERVLALAGVATPSSGGPSVSTVAEAAEAEKSKAATEFWKWREYTWKAPNHNDWRKAKSLTAGVDIGSVSSQAVIMADGEILAYSSVRTGSQSRNSASKAIAAALEGTGMVVEDLKFVVGTGYGRVNVPFAQKTVTEIACHARGANFLGGPTIRTILDMGGQDCKGIRCDERGKVVSFLMNDKCAAGTGRGMEVMADLLAIPIDEIGPLSLSVNGEPPPVSSTCVVFAKSEALDLMRQGWSKAEVLAAYCAAMAKRVVILLERVGVEKEFAITGGIAKNSGVVRRVEKALGVKSLEIKPDPQIAGAVGASLFAADFLAKLSKVA